MSNELKVKDKSATQGLVDFVAGMAMAVAKRIAAIVAMIAIGHA